MALRLKTQQAENIFNKLNIERSSTNHHVKGFLVIDGRKRFPPIYFSKGRKEMPPSVSEKFRKSLMLTPEEMNELARCRMSKERYLDIRRAHEE